MYAAAALRQVSFRAIGWLAVFAMLAVALLGPTASRTLAASVDPILIDENGNSTCADFAVSHGGGQAWEETKQDPPGNGTITVDEGTITISNFDGKTFDWESTFGIDAVFVKAGSAGSNLYVYAATADAPESMGDTGLTSPGEGDSNAISHISFCWDEDVPPPSSAPPSAPPSSAPPSGNVSPPPSESVPPGSVAPSETVPATPPQGSVAPSETTPTTTLPPTDALGNAGPTSDSWRALLIAMAGILASALVMTPARSARRR